MSDQDIIARALEHKKQCDATDRNLLTAWLMNHRGTDQYKMSVCLYQLAGCHLASQSPSLLKADPAQAKGWETRRDEHIATFRTLNQVEIELP